MPDTYYALFVDDEGKYRSTRYYCDTEADAITIWDAIRATTQCGCVKLVKASDVSVTTSTAQAGSSRHVAALLLWSVVGGSPAQRMMLPHPIASVVTPSSPTTDTDPIGGVGVLVTEEGTELQAFIKGSYKDGGKIILPPF